MQEQQDPRPKRVSGRLTGASTSMPSRRQPGSCDGESDLPLTLRRRSGSSAAGEPAAERTAAASESDQGALDDCSVGGVESGSKGGPKPAVIST